MERIPFFIDFDRVLFDTDTLREELCAVLCRAGFSTATVEESYKSATVDRQYIPAKHIHESIKRQPEIVVDSTALVEELYSSVNNMLYADSTAFLERLNRECYEIILLTLGNPDFQQLKIDATGVAHYFDTIQICTVEKAEFLATTTAPGARFVLLDDRKDTIQNIQQQYQNSFTIFKDYKNEHPLFAQERSARIVTLSEITQLVLPEPFMPLLVAE